jgi:hypothetical protein
MNIKIQTAPVNTLGQHINGDFPEYFAPYKIYFSMLSSKSQGTA